MNSFGRLFKVEIFGESHGSCIGVVLDGVPAGLPISEKDFKADLKRRNPKLKGVTARKEEDRPLIKSGIFKGKTTGAPIMIMFENKDVDSSRYEALKDTPRPGHADLTAFKKWKGFNDYRGAGPFSGRLTVPLVAAGVVAKKLLKGIKINSSVIRTGDVNKALKKGDSVGGIVDCSVKGVPVCLGEPFFDSVESLLGHIIFAVPGIKGIEFGEGFKGTQMYGSEFNKSSKNTGGINGGITNGNEIYFRVAVRPAASISKPQETINLRTGKKEKISIQGRFDTCFAVRVPPVIEAVTAIVLLDLMLLEQKIERVV